MKKNPSSKKLKISSWNHTDRPREKYLEKGFQSLTNAELIAILIRSGTNEESAVDLAIRLLHQNDQSLNKLAEMNMKELLAMYGIGVAKATAIKAAFELGQRRRAEKVLSRKKIKLAADIVEVMQDKIAHIPHEEFWTIFLNQGSRILSIDNFGKGGLTSTTVDVRMIMKRALEENATSIVLCHNHPSGELKPSRQDIALTDQVQKAAAFLNIRLLDHLILHKDYYFSFLSESLL